MDCSSSVVHIDEHNSVPVGSIQISGISGNVGAYTLSWNNGSTNANLSNLQAGTYTLTITDWYGGQEVREFKIGYLTKWVNVSGFGYIPWWNSLNKFGSTNSWSNGVAISANVLKSEVSGSVKYTPPNVYDNTYRMFGLTNYNTVAYYASIKYAIRTYNDDVYIYESGFPTHTRQGILQYGDELEVERSGANIFYSRIRHGKKWTFYTSSSSVNIYEELHADLSLYNTNSNMSSIVTTFDVQLDLTADVTHIDIDNVIPGAIDLSVLGVSGPYSYSWSNGSITEDISPAYQGLHTVTVTDQFGNTNVFSGRVDYIVRWDYTDGILYDEANNVLEKNSATSNWGNNGASSCNKLVGFQDGRVSYEVESLDQRFIGLAEFNEENWYSFNDHSIWQSNNYYRIYEKGVSKGTFGTVAIGDIVTLEREGSNVYYKIKKVGQEEVVLKTTTNVDSSKALYADASIYYNGTKISELLASYTCRTFSNYIKPQKKIDGAIYLPTGNKFYLNFDELYNTNNSLLELRVIDESNNEYIQNNLNVVSHGDNRHEIDLSDFSSTISSGYYLLEIVNNKKEKRYLRFKI